VLDPLPKNPLSRHQVLERYESEGYSFLVQAFNDSHFLEKVTGLDKLYAEGEEALKDIEELDEEDDDF
jgi:ubiquitin-like modifier-activating enzyme ATG7